MYSFFVVLAESSADARWHGSLAALSRFFSRTEKSFRLYAYDFYSFDLSLALSCSLSYENESDPTVSGPSLPSHLLSSVRTG